MLLRWLPPTHVHAKVFMKVWARKVFGKESPEWKRVEAFDGGRWGVLRGYMKEYEVVF